jgi:endonuclease/exonuclease/phosphatase family metal-dependent hydrolase
MTQRITVASYNIHGCVGKDRARDVARVAQVIRDIDADVVGLQEVDSRAGPHSDSMQMDYLSRETGLQAIGGAAIMRYNRHYGNLILTRHPVRDVRRIDLSVRRQEPRGAVDVDLDIHGVLVRVLVTHFGLGIAERRFQAQRLLKALDQYPAEPTTILVVMGDFNEWFPLSRSLGWLSKRLGPVRAPLTYPAFLPLLPLDRIWVTPASALIDIQALNTGQTRICSDHLPVKATIDTDVRAFASR